MATSIIHPQDAEEVPAVPPIEVGPYADGSLPAPGVYGVPDAWPHVSGVLQRAGFAPGERVEADLTARGAAGSGASDRYPSALRAARAATSTGS